MSSFVVEQCVCVCVCVCLIVLHAVMMLEAWYGAGMICMCSVAEAQQGKFNEEEVICFA